MENTTSTLTNEERLLLKEIMNDKFSAGAFAGMIFNSFANNPQIEINEQSVDVVTRNALMIRLRLKELSK